VTPTPAPLPGGFSGNVPGPEEGQRVIALALGEDDSAVLGTFEAGIDSILQLGTWEAAANVVTVNLTLRDGNAFEDTIVFTLTGDELLATQFDQAVHGPELRLQRDPTAPTAAESPAVGTYFMVIDLNAPVTPTPLPLETPVPGPTTKGGQELPNSGLGEDLLLLVGGGLLLLAVIAAVRRMRSA
jgi:hypothetical protein